MKQRRRAICFSSMLIAVLFATSVLAASADKINRRSNKALEVFKEEVNGAEMGEGTKFTKLDKS